MGSLTTVKASSVASLRRPAHITVIRCPHHWNTHLQAFINAFPVANGSPVTGIDGLAYFIGAFSLPSSLDTHSIRLDHAFDSQTHVFGHYNNTTSSTQNRSSSDLAQLSGDESVSRAVTSGLTRSFGSHIFNDARFNYSWTRNKMLSLVDGYGGATPSTLGAFLPNAPSPYSQFGAFIFLGSVPAIDLANFDLIQTQLNLVDTQQFSLGRHSLKLGVDYRHLASTSLANQLLAILIYGTKDELENNSAGLAQISTTGLVPPEPIYSNWSAFCQDEWKATSSTTISYGIRWDINPPPSNGNGRIPPVLDQVRDLSTAQIAPGGTPEWSTYYEGFAPRFGLASELHKSPGRETVLRIGVGNFFDTGNTLGSLGFTYLGFASRQSYSGMALPFSDSIYKLPAPSTATPYNQTVVAFDRNLKLPYTLQWNVALEQVLGGSRSLTLGYVGSAGRRLINGQFVDPSNVNDAFSSGNGAYIITNSSWSNYDSLQAQFDQKLSRGFQLLASMTWAHSIDNRSTSFINYQPLLKADSDFDIRRNFQLAATYNLQVPRASRSIRLLADRWAFDLRAFSRSAPPVDVYGSAYFAPDGTEEYARPNLLPGTPLYVHGNNIPGGTQFNFAAFDAVTGVQGNTPRNYLRGFPATEADAAVRREFRIENELHLQFRAEAFNLLNHPIFGSIYNDLTYGPNQFGLAYNTLNVALQNQSALYEQGGPRSLQLAIKILF